MTNGNGIKVDLSKAVAVTLGLLGIVTVIMTWDDEASEVAAQVQANGLELDRHERRIEKVEEAVAKIPAMARDIDHAGKSNRRVERKVDQLDNKIDEIRDMLLRGHRSGNSDARHPGALTAPHR